MVPQKKILPKENHDHERKDGDRLLLFIILVPNSTVCPHSEMHPLSYLFADYISICYNGLEGG
jgi:hypothetical protein